jgi:LacI family transcriptional regulator
VSGDPPGGRTPKPAGPARPPKLSDVAVRAGVSSATASRVLNGSERAVREPYRSKVLAAAAELGYTANAHAQAIARGTSNVLGLVVHDVADPYFSAIADGVMREAAARDVMVMLAVTRRDPERELEYVATLRAQRARAVILAGSRTTDAELVGRLGKELAAFTAAGGSAACISQATLGVHTVVPQNRDGARRLAVALHGLGHERFAVLAGPQELVVARDRLRGFRAGLTASGVAGDRVRVLTGSFTREGGYEAANALLADGLGATCVFAVNDVMAVGAMAAFRDAGLSVPGDVSVAGFDDIATLRDVTPRLTTVRLPLEEMGTHAARLALDPAADEAPTVMTVRGDVLLRQSTAPPRHV